MSVSDDSKMKFIETKYRTLYSIYNQIEDKEFQKCLALCEVKIQNPELYKLLEKYDKSSLSVNFDVKQVEKQIIEKIRNKCIEVLNLISGEDVNTEHVTDSELQSLLHSKLDKLGLDVLETDNQYRMFDQKFGIYQKLFGQYLDAITLYYSKYKLGFKLLYDEHMTNLLMSKAQALCIRERHIETEAVAQKYGNKETIQKLREERKALEAEEYTLKTELKKAEEKLSLYENLDKDLLKQYRQLKDDLECRYWAISELNQSSGSASNGSVNGISD